MKENLPVVGMVGLTTCTPKSNFRRNLCWEVAPKPYLEPTDAKLNSPDCESRFIEVLKVAIELHNHFLVVFFDALEKTCTEVFRTKKLASQPVKPVFLGWADLTRLGMRGSWSCHHCKTDTAGGAHPKTIFFRRFVQGAAPARPIGAHPT